MWQSPCPVCLATTPSPREWPVLNSRSSEETPLLQELVGRSSSPGDPFMGKNHSPAAGAPGSRWKWGALDCWCRSVGPTGHLKSLLLSL